MKTVIYILFLMLTRVHTCNVQPVVCTCYIQQTIAYCVDKNLNQPPTFPRTIASQLKRISLVGNRIKSLLPKYVNQFPNMLSIDFRAQRVKVNCTSLLALQYRPKIQSDCPYPPINKNITTISIILKNDIKTEVKSSTPALPTRDTPYYTLNKVNYRALIMAILLMLMWIIILIIISCFHQSHSIRTQRKSLQIE